MRRDYVIADVSLGVGSAALVSGLVLYLARPNSERSANSARVMVEPALTGYSSGACGLSAEGSW